MEAVGELIWKGSYGSTTIDQICERAGVKKGSFYYFFESKADVAVAAIDQECGRMRPELDGIFSPTVPPLERFRKYCDFGYKLQADMKAKCGFVLGCPLFTLGSEVSTQESRLQKKIHEILDQKLKYLESAIRDANAAGLVNVPDASGKAKILFAYYQGLYTQARIENSLDVLKDALRGTFELLGVREAAPVAA
jgi:TetR/AcrR family transcriptional regulator, transcriptional repressor for nem operon